MRFDSERSGQRVRIDSHGPAQAYGMERIPNGMRIEAPERFIGEGRAISTGSVFYLDFMSAGKNDIAVTVRHFLGYETVGEAFENPNKIGFTQKAYYDSIFLMSKILSFDVIDLRTKTGFCKQTVPLYQPDNVHPNAAGCEIIAKILYNHIKLSF